MPFISPVLGGKLALSLDAYKRSLL
jgi:hypothetical protein